jgi:hypothetical protein
MLPAVGLAILASMGFGSSILPGKHDCHGRLIAQSFTDINLRLHRYSLAVLSWHRTSLQSTPECRRWWCVRRQHRLGRHFDHNRWHSVQNHHFGHTSTQEARMVGD